MRPALLAGDPRNDVALNPSAPESSVQAYATRPGFLAQMHCVYETHPLRANIAETLSPALITEQGENG